MQGHARNQGFDPETIAVLRSALEAAWSTLSDQQKATLPQSLLAERILKTAARGERDPVRLRASALMGAVPFGGAGKHLVPEAAHVPGGRM